MVQERPAAAHGIIRSGLIVSFLGSLAWCVNSFSYEPVLVSISTGSMLLGVFSLGKATLREALFGFVVVAAHAFYYSGLSVGLANFFWLLVLPLVELDYVYTVLVFIVLGFLVGLFHGCLRSLAKPPLRLLEDVVPWAILAGLCGAFIGLIFPFLESIPFPLDMSLWGQLALRIAVLPVAFLVTATIGALPAIVDSYFMAEAELNRPTRGLKRTPNGAA